MGVTSQGRHYNDPVDLPAAALASAARVVATAQGTPFSVEDADKIVGRLNITLHNGGTVVGSLETSVDGTNYHTAGAWPSKSGSNQTHTKEFDVSGAAFARWAWVVSVATVTFRVDSTQAVGRR